MTEIDLTALRAIAEKAHAAAHPPWSRLTLTHIHTSSCNITASQGKMNREQEYKAEAVAAFIAIANPATIIALLDRLADARRTCALPDTPT